MAKLHELLAVDRNLEGQAEKCRKDLTSTFNSKKQLFSKKIVQTEFLEENTPTETKVESDIQTSVIEELEWLGKIAARSMDASFAIECANTHAKADVVLEDGSVFIKDVPATALLLLEKRLKGLAEFVAIIPTLDSAKGFRLDANEGIGRYKARLVEKPKTEKRQEPLVLYAATKEHPAQTQLISRDVKIGTITEMEWSSLITPSAKAEIIDRLEEITRAVSKARSRAAQADVDIKGLHVGKKIWDHIFVGKKDQKEKAPDETLS